MSHVIQNHMILEPGTARIKGNCAKIR